MKVFLTELKNRNKLLYWFGWYNLIAGIICVVLMQTDSIQLLGVSRWLKPMKFFFSVWMMSWTMGWLLYYLDYRKSVGRISWFIVVSMFIENFIITLQSLRGVRSHFNVQNATDNILFSIMGIFILLFSFTILRTIILFFRQKIFSIPYHYLWAVRLGLIFFLIFSVEGGFMLSKMSHTVGGNDGGPGLPFTNWSTKYGDLRIAHFLGIHSLQLLPLSAQYLFKKTSAVFIFGSSYFLLVVLLLIRALNGIPFV